VHILHLISSEGYYGAENMLVHLSRSLGDLGCESFLGVFENLHRPNLEVAERARRQGGSVEIIRCRGKAHWGAVRRIRECIRERKIDVIHCHGYKSTIYGYAAAKLSRVPLIATCHGWPGKSLALRFYYWLDRVVLRSFDQVVAVSDRIQQSLEQAGLAPERIRIIANGVDIARFAGPAPSRAEISGHPDFLRIGVVGRLAPEKGIPVLFQAAREILMQHPRTQFVLVGDGPDRAKLESLARELGIEDHVTFAGVCADMPTMYASFDIFVLPSLSEGMPLAILEAMAAGKAVVASRVGAISHLVISGQTGFTVEPRDVPGLRDSILRLMENQRLREQFGEEGRLLVTSHYSAEKMAKSYLAVYQGVLDGQRLVA